MLLPSLFLLIYANFFNYVTSLTPLTFQRNDQTDTLQYHRWNGGF